MSAGNYPDDIRRFDRHPLSPFYEEPPECEVCDSPLTQDGACQYCEDIAFGACPKDDCLGSLAVRIDDGVTVCIDCAFEINPDQAAHKVSPIKTDKQEAA